MKKIILRILIYLWIFLIGVWSPAIYLFTGSIGSPQIDHAFAFSVMRSLLPYSVTIVGPVFVALYYFFHKRYEKTVKSVVILFSGFYIGAMVFAQFQVGDYRESNATIAGLITSIVWLAGYLAVKFRKDFSLVKS